MLLYNALSSWLTASLGTFNEKLLLGQGLSISPLKEGVEGAAASKSLREVIQQIDNRKDYHDYVLSHEFNPGAVTSEQVQYHRHPVSPLKHYLFPLSSDSF